MNQESCSEKIWPVSSSAFSLALLPHLHFRSTLQVQDERSTSYPSLLSHLTSMYLNMPPLALPVAKKQVTSSTLRSFHPLTSPLPCDFHLLNLRTIPAEVSVPVGAKPHHQVLAFPPPLLCLALPWAEGLLTLHCSCLLTVFQDTLPSADAALILHRKGFDCGLEAKNLGFNCTTSQGKVSRAQVWGPGRGPCQDSEAGLSAVAELRA